jgi:hypothetical protein
MEMIVHSFDVSYPRYILLSTIMHGGSDLTLHTHATHAAVVAEVSSGNAVRHRLAASCLAVRRAWQQKMTSRHSRLELEVLIFTTHGVNADAAVLGMAHGGPVAAHLLAADAMVDMPAGVNLAWTTRRYVQSGH